MTALLKKRALAEYTVQVVETPVQKPIKKLRLIKKHISTSAISYVVLLDNCKTSNEALQILLRISESLHLKEEEFPIIVRKLAEHFNQQAESAVRTKVISILGSIGELPGANIDAIIDCTIKLIKRDNSHKVIAQGLNTILCLSNHLKATNSLLNKVFSVAKYYLKDTNHWVKRLCLQIIGTINIGDNVCLVSDYMHSQDARVRAAAISTMLLLHCKGQKVDVSLYSEVCLTLSDDYEIVREESLKLVCALGNTYPEQMVKVANSEEEVRLIDDAFGKICQAVNDLSMHVRLQATQLLGTMTQVSSGFLNQTLDKKLMSDMRKKKSLHERSSDIMASGEWSTGKKWADDAPKELLNKDEVNVVSSGACGAFVHGLEDEFMEVRSASVDALCNLATHHPEFASLSLDFLVDMFNDEIEGVRIKAIDSLTVMSQHILLREHQLETILGALEDFSIDVREGLHRMLAACLLSTKDCLKMCIEHLLDNLKKYPQDKRSTWKCVKEIGSKHSDLTLPLVPQLLAIHPFFDTPEPDVEDPHYITLLILVFNAAQRSPTMLQLFEEHTIKHYSYLRVTMPSLVPHLNLSGSLVFTEPQSTTAGFVLLNSLVEDLSGPPRVRDPLIQCALPQLARLAEIDSSIAGPAHFTTMFITCQILLGKILKDKLWYSNASTTVQGNAIKNMVTQLLTLCLKLQYLFVGLGESELAAVKQFKLKALALHLVYIIRVSNLSALALCEHFLSKVEEAQWYFTRPDVQVSPDEFCEELFLSLLKLEDTKPGPVARCLLPILSKAIHVSPPKPNANVRVCKAVLNGPSTSPDGPLKFSAGLVMATPIEADIYGLQDPSSLRIKIHYPDHQTHICMPSSNDLRSTGSQSSDEPDYRLLTKALISHGVWSEACYVEISLCVELSENELAHRAHYGIEPYLDICKPLKLYVAPKAVRRGL